MLERRDYARLGIVLVSIAVAVLLIVWRYVSLMLLSPHEERRQTQSIVVERGPILDRTGRVLAIQTKLFAVTAWIPAIEDVQQTAEELAETLELDYGDVLETLRERSGFAYIKRKVSQRESKAVSDLISSGRITGVSLVEDPARSYPEQTLAAHVLGIVNIDNEGLEGVELMMDDVLRPAEAVGTQTSSYGNQVFLTIDVNVQYIAETLAAETMREHRADSVMVLVMDARTGGFLGYASQPTFNPNAYLDYPESNRINRPAVVAYEPGSVFKVFSISAFLELGGIGGHSEFVCNGYYEHPDIPERIKCLGVHGRVSATEIIKFSCNAGAAYASERVGQESFHALLRHFGFGETTGLPVPGESSGLLKDPSNWSSRTKPTLAFGQEISTSAVQIVTAATALANGGILLEPHLVKRIVSPEGDVIKNFGRTPRQEVLSAETAEAMLAMMVGATQTGGTAWRAAVDGVQVAAKTGTAQIFNTSTGQYSDDEFIASCLAVVPADNPQLIVYVVIDNPKAGEFYGGRIAAPVISTLVDQTVSYLGIPRASDRVLEHDGTVEITPLPELSIDGEVPDFTGYSKRRLLPLLKDSDVKMRIIGEGWVVDQTPEPGTPFAPGMSITVELE